MVIYPYIYTPYSLKLKYQLRLKTYFLKFTLAYYIREDMEIFYIIKLHVITEINF